MPIRIIFMIFLIVLMSACSKPYSAVIKQFREAPICCTAMNQFKFEALKMGESKSFKLNEETDAFVFDTGKSYFKAFEIPREGYPYHILIKSYMLGDHIEEAYIFIPYVLTLDEKYNVVRSTVPSLLRLKKAGFTETMKETGGLGRKLESFILFTDENKNEKYIVILTTESLLQEKIFKAYRSYIPIILPGFVTIVPDFKDRLALIPASPVGHLNVSVIPGFPKDFVVIQHQEKAFTIFMMIPGEAADKVKAAIKKSKDIDIVTLEEFMKRPHDFILPRIIRNEYEDSKIEQVVVNFLHKHSAIPIGVSWNGGIITTREDAEYARKTYKQYIESPEEYMRTKIKDAHADPLNPQRNLGRHFGPLFEW